jgi:dihydrolipoamide dehydrogenase
MKEIHFNVMFLGSGPGGYVAALKAAQLGAKVAVVEKGPLGGTCLNNGCIPSKALLASAEMLHAIREAGKLGIKIAGEVTLDWAAVQQRKDRTVARLRQGIASLFKARGVTLYQGMGKLEGAGRVSVTDAKGQAQGVTTDRTIIAVGSVPSRIPGWPTDPQRVCTSDEALHWKDLPSRLLIVGGGVIGCEFACMMQALGVTVTLVEMMPRLLPEMDADLAAELTKVFTARRIACHTGTKVAELKLSDAGITATLDNGQTIEADRVLVATGRRPATADINLAAAGLTADRGFVRVNDRMETPVAGVYCIGDANGRCLLAHAASAQGMVAVENALGHSRSFDAPVPWAVYTFPEIAGVGLTEEQADKRNVPVSVGIFPIGYLGKAMAVGHTDGLVKVIRDRGTGALLGVHMIGHNVTEVVAAATCMLGEKATTAELAETVFAHPTISEAVKEAAEDALSAAIHLPPKKAVTAVAGM